MKSRRTALVAIATALVAAAIGASTSNAASVDLGAQCTPTIGTAGSMFVNTTGSSVVVPFSGVITKWGFTFPSTAPFTTNLITVRGADPNWTVTSVTAAVPIDSAETSVPTRISVQAGDRIGMAPVGLGCATTAADTLAKATAASNPTVGTAYTTSTTTAASSTDLTAHLEPDADGDGYGDETQDACPQSKLYQTACPTPKLASYPLKSSKNFQVLVTTDIPGTVFATGKVKLPKTKGKKAKTLTFKSKGVAVLPGVLSKLTLKYPSALTGALKTLSPSKKLRLSVTITVPGILSNSTKTFAVKLAGRK